MEFSFRAVVLIWLAALAGGCNSGNKSSETEREQTASATASEGAGQLAGFWYGRAHVDRDRLAAQRRAIADERDLRALDEIARTFLTTEIGARFDASGEMELEVQIQTTGGQVLRDSTTGTWRVIDASNDVVWVETVEQLPGGGTETSRVRYELSDDGHTAVMPAPTSELLAGCNPVFVFQRIESVSAALSDGSNRSDR